MQVVTHPNVYLSRRCTFPKCRKSVAKHEWFCAEHDGAESKDHVRALRERLLLEQHPLSVGWYFVYAVQSGDSVKIGRTQRLTHRLYNLRGGSPQKIELLGYALARHDLELLIHRHLKPHRIHGEWFRLCDAVSQVVDLIVKDDEDGIRKLIAA